MQRLSSQAESAGISLDDVLKTRAASKSSADEVTVRKKKFLVRYLKALHNAGNLTHRTVKHFLRVAKAMDVPAGCVILPTSAIVSFPHGVDGGGDPSESIIFSLSGGWNYDKLSHLDRLGFEIYRDHIDLEQAEARLAQIMKSPDL